MTKKKDGKKINIKEVVDKMKASKDWVDRYHPEDLNEYVFPEKYKQLVKNWISLEKKRNGSYKLDMPNIMLIGYQGLGKTTLAKIITKELNIKPLFINASTQNGIDVVRKQLQEFATRKSVLAYTQNDIDKKIIVLDEFDNFTVEAQKSLRGFIEEYKDRVRFIATLNYPEKIIPPIRSRFKSGELFLDKIYKENQSEIITQLLHRIFSILKKESIEYEESVVVDAIKMFYPDFRSILSILYQEYIRNGDLKNKIQNIDSKLLIDILKKGDIRELHEYAKNTYVENQIFVELRKYFVEKGEHQAIVELARASWEISFSVDKVITITNLLLILSKLVK